MFCKRSANLIGSSESQVLQCLLISLMSVSQGQFKPYLLEQPVCDGN